MKYTAKQEEQLMRELWSPRFTENPYNYVMFSYPWGKKDTVLEHIKGPRKWQKRELLLIADHIQKNKRLINNGKSPEVYQLAIASGRGPGKSALFAWLSDWFRTCIVGSTNITTANTESQLKSRTWAEFRKWQTMSINAHWFEPHALSIKPAPWYSKLVKEDLGIDPGYYYSEAQSWSAENPDAFAGAHNPLGMMLLFDEASGIDDSIWKVSEGFFTEPVLHRYWIAFSNPRQNSGSFFKCFNAHRKYWRNLHIDSREVEGTDHAVYEKIIDTHGEDSDVARIEVKGLFPHQGANQFISNGVVEHATDRDIMKDNGAPLVMGVDVARFGDDSTVIRFRQGRDAKSIAPIIIRSMDNMQVAYFCAEAIDKYNPDAVNIDAGNGSGVIDRLRELKYKVNEIWFNSRKIPSDSEYYNLRTYMWGETRNWLLGGCVDDSKELFNDLTAPQYGFQGGGDKIILEAKDSMKARGLASPDHGDALALTFAVKVSRRNTPTSLRSRKRLAKARDVDYDVFNY